MSKPFSDTYWQTEFDITTDDLDRIANWMRKDHQAFTLTVLAKRIVRGRLEHGEDTSLPALPEWVQEQKVLSWDAEEQWEIGSRVLVARKINQVLSPFIGIIVDENYNTFIIRMSSRDLILSLEIEVRGRPRQIRIGQQRLVSYSRTPELVAALNEIQRLREDIRIKNLSPEKEKRLWDELTTRAVYHTNHLEGNPLTFEEAKAVIDEYQRISDDEGDHDIAQPQ